MLKVRKGGGEDAQGVLGPSSSCVWHPRVFADDARGCTGEENGNPLQLFLPGKSHGRRSLVGCRTLC